MFNPEDFEKLTDKEFAQIFIKIHGRIMDDPINNFVEAELFGNTILTPGQRVLFKLVMNYPLNDIEKFDCIQEMDDEDTEGFSLKDIKLTETELYKYFTGKDYSLNTVDKIRDVTLIVGRRGGKTMCASILAIWSAIKKNWRPMLGRKKTATILVMSHTKEFSDEIIDEVRAIIEDSPILSRLINHKAKNTQSTINLKIPFEVDGVLSYSYVRIRTSAASSKSSRGSACPCIIADEIAFWGSDPNSKETDKEIVRAVKPSMLQFEDDAMWIELSTPNIREGVLFEKYDKRDNLTSKQIILKAPSWVFNNRYRAVDYVDFWLEDEENFDREFRANFTDSLGSFFTPESVDLAVMRGVKVIPPADKKDRVKYICAIDSAFKGDIFTVNVIGVHENRVKQYAVLGFKGTKKFPVQANEVAKAVRELSKQYGFERVYGDQFSFQPLREIFATYNLTLIEKTFSQPFKQKIYKNLQYMLEGQQLDLLDHDPTKKELKAIQVEISTTGRIKIMHPPGGHDDYSDSLAIACYVSKEESGQLESDVVMTDVKKDYGIRVDVNGVAFSAPSAEMLADHVGIDVTDNSGMYTKDPTTGKLVRCSDLEEDDDDSDGGGPDVVF